MSDFADAMTALADQAGDTSEETPTPAAAAVTPEAPAASPEQQPSSADTATATGSDDDLRSLLDAKKAAHPELADTLDAIHKEFQRGLTPKLQEAAELRKQFEGVDPGDVQFLRQVQELALVSPQAAATLWEQAKQQLLGSYAPAPSADPGLLPQQGDWEPETENERILQQEVQELRSWQQQETIARTRADMDRQFADIGKEFGAEIPFEQRQAAARYCLQNNIPPTQIGLVWKGMHGMQAAKRAGRDEASAVVERKAAMTPVPSQIATPPAAPPSEPNSLREALERAAGM